MKTSFSTFCLFLALLCVRLNGTAAEEPQRYAIEFLDDINCRRGDPPSVYGRNVMYPTPRIGRRSESPTYTRAQRVFGLVKQPRVGRSDPLMAESDRPSWFAGNSELRHPAGVSYHLQGPGERMENLRNVENYLSAHRRDSNAPWAFFVITPNFQNADQNVDKFLPPLGHEMNAAIEDQ